MSTRLAIFMLGGPRIRTFTSVDIIPSSGPPGMGTATVWPSSVGGKPSDYTPRIRCRSFRPFNSGALHKRMNLLAIVRSMNSAIQTL